MYYDSGRSNDKRSRRINLIKSSPLHCQNAKFKIFWGVSLSNANYIRLSDFRKLVAVHFTTNLGFTI